MGLSLRWVGPAEGDRVAEVRAQCYAHSLKDLARFRAGLSADTRAGDGDFLLAEQDRRAVGTAASLPLTMWVRGARVACQGVAYVGTVKTHRRGAKGPGGGIATQIMVETIRRAREREFAATALMPFRASFYEHFGYGTVETRNQWTLPMSVLPTGAFDGFRFMEPGDLNAIESLRQQSVERGQCDIERSSSYWNAIVSRAEEGMLVVDRPANDGPAAGYLWLQHASEHGREMLKVMDAAHRDVASLRRQLHFLASLKDQYSAVVYPLPADLQLQWLLREVQLPHRPVTHHAAELKVINRLQVRVLDHKRFIESMRLPEVATGRVTVAIRETEGNVSRLAIQFEGGRASVKAIEGATDFTCTDRVWAAVVCGELLATHAVQLGMAEAASADRAKMLDTFSQGPRPFCTEAF